jgi:hypothetical protein
MALAWSGRVGAINTFTPEEWRIRCRSSFSWSNGGQVEVDEHNVRVALGEGDREVRRDERLPGATLRPEDCDERSGRLAGHHEALPASDDLLDRERDFARGLRKRDHVVGPRFEDLPQKAVRRRLGHDDHGPVGPVLHGPVDHLSCAVVPGGASDDDDVGRLLEELAPVVEVVGVADDLERRIAVERLLD